MTANTAIANLMQNAGHAQQIAVAAIRLLGAQPADMAPEVLARLAVILS